MACLIVGLFPLCLAAQFTDGLNVEFGKNRVQYREFDWQYYTQGTFEIFYYQGGQQVAGQIARKLEEEAAHLSPMFGRNIEGPIQVLVFNSQEEFRQSNVGIMSSVDQESNIGGTARLVGSKMFLYGTGDRLSLERDIREGLARILFNQSMYESQWSEALRSGNLVQVPEWMLEGAARFASRGVDPESEAIILDACQTGMFSRMDQTNGKQAAILGQAVWAYIADIYGLPTVANVLYMTRITHSVESGFRLATGYYLNDLASEVRAYHLSNAPEGFDSFLPPFESKRDLRKAKKTAGPDVPMTLNQRLEYTQFLLSPDGSQIAFTTNERGQIRVGTLDMETGEHTWRSTIGHRLDRLDNDQHPVMAWRPDGKVLAYSTVLQGDPRIGFINMQTDESELKRLYDVDQVLSMSYSPDGAYILMSALKGGSSDLYRYDVLANNQRPLWRDRFDDLHPAFWPGSTTFMFASNRPDDTLRNDKLDHPYPTQMDLYVADLNESPISIQRWTETPEVDERWPQPLEGGEFAFVAQSPLNTTHIGLGWKDSTIVAIDTIVRYRTFTQLRKAIELPVPATTISIRKDVAYVSVHRAGQLGWRSIEMPDITVLHSKTQLPSIQSDSFVDSGQPYVLPKWERRWLPDEINYRNYVFELEKQPQEPDDGDVTTEDALPVEYERLIPRIYRLNYALDKLQTTLNNTFGTSFYQPYNGQVNAQPGLGNATEIRISDLMDDRHLVGGYTIPVNLSNTFFGLAFMNLEGQLDKELSFQRQSSSRYDGSTGQLVETSTHLLRREWRWAVDEVRSFRWGLPLDSTVMWFKEPICFL